MIFDAISRKRNQLSSKTVVVLALQVHQPIREMEPSVSFHWTEKVLSVLKAARNSVWPFWMLIPLVCPWHESQSWTAPDVDGCCRSLEELVNSDRLWCGEKKWRATHARVWETSTWIWSNAFKKSQLFWLIFLLCFRCFWRWHRYEEPPISSSKLLSADA